MMMMMMMMIPMTMTLMTLLDEVMNLEKKVETVKEEITAHMQNFYSNFVKQS